MKKNNMVFFNIFKLTGLCILVLGALMGTVKANPINLPPLPTPAQFVDGLKSNFESFISALKKDDELFKKGGAAFGVRSRELEDLAKKQKLNGGHIWLPFMNESDNTLVQVFMTPPLVLSPGAEATLVVAQLFAQMMRYKIRPLTPLEFFVFSRYVVFDTLLFQGIINFVPENAKINGVPVRKILTNIVARTEMELGEAIIAAPFLLLKYAIFGN